MTRKELIYRNGAEYSEHLAHIWIIKSGDDHSDFYKWRKFLDKLSEMQAEYMNEKN